jgi:hypothetical protein
MDQGCDNCKDLKMRDDDEMTKRYTSMNYTGYATVSQHRPRLRLQLLD